MRKIYWVVIFIFLYFGVSSQDTNNGGQINAKSNTNNSSQYPSNQKTFDEIKKSYTEAIQSKNHDNEIKSLLLFCNYYDENFDFKNILEYANLTINKSVEYNMPIYCAIGRDYLFKGYVYSGLYEEGKQQLEKGLKVLRYEDEYDSTVIATKSNLYISYSNYYLLKKDFKNKLKYIRLSISEHDKFKNQNFKNRIKCIDYSNLSSVFLEYNTDSAEYYALKSMELEKYCNSKEAFINNAIVIGTVSEKRKQYEKAIQYFKKAELLLTDHQNHFNLKLVYDNLIYVYSKINDTLNVKKYKSFLENFDLQLSERKNETLTKVITDIKHKNESRIIYFVFIIIFIIIVSIIIIWSILHKRSVLIKQEQLSQQYFKDQKNEYSESEYANLIDLFKKNDLVFFNSFSNTFPNFSTQLRKINPNIVQSEIEFCALLKLNISTKEIAKYRFIEPKSVQNKKYRIRKRLGIPQNTDIYDWFHQI
jgi:tetratricopeptide (TPR) repeat protein